MKRRLYDEYIRRLLEVNDESKTEDEHRFIVENFRGWKQGVEDAANYRFNGDYYYIDKFDAGEMVERPLCCGEFLDWKHKDNKDAPQENVEAKPEQHTTPQACNAAYPGTGPLYIGGTAGVA